MTNIESGFPSSRVVGARFRAFSALPTLLVVLACGGDGPLGVNDDGWPNVQGTYVFTDDFRVQEQSCGAAFTETLGDVGDTFQFLGDSTTTYVSQIDSAVSIGSVSVVLEKDGTFRSSVDVDLDDFRHRIDGEWITVGIVTRSWSEGVFFGDDLRIRAVVDFQFELVIPEVGSDRCKVTVGTTAHRISAERSPGISPALLLDSMAEKAVVWQSAEGKTAVVNP